MSLFLIFERQRNVYELLKLIAGILTLSSKGGSNNDDSTGSIKSSGGCGDDDGGGGINGGGDAHSDVKNGAANGGAGTKYEHPPVWSPS